MSRKDYEMAFKLSAQMNSNFSGAFKSAQTTLSAFQKKIQEVNRTQGDVAAYQKQQKAVEATKQKMEMLQRQYDNIQKEIQETGGYSSDLENKLISKQAQIDKTRLSLEQYQQKLTETGQKLREAGVDTGNMEQASKKLESELGQLKKEQKEAADSAEEFGEKGSQSVTQFGDALAAAGIVAGLKQIYDGFMACVEAAGSFEETISTVEALSGASAGEIEALSDEAKRLGAATQYTAKESAEAMTYMAMAGWDAQDMLGGMSGVIQLAASSGEDLATTSDIVTDALTAFGLSASDTSHFADVLATAATNANTTVAGMGETFKYAAPLAGALGYSVEDVATMIGLMANNGIKASQSGTALRSMFQNLTDGAELSAAAFGDVTIETQNSDGSMRSLSDVMEDLRDCFSQMTEAEKMSNAEMLVGSRAMSGFISIMNSTSDDYNKLSASINNCSGAAQKMADIKLDNMNGQLKLAQSAWEGVTIAVGEQFAPAMSLVYEVAAKAFGEIKKWVDEHPGMVKALGAFAAILGVAVVASAAYTAAMIAAQKATALFMATVPVVGWIMGIAAAIGAVTAAIVASNAAANQGVDSVKDLASAAREMEEAMTQAGDAFDDTVAKTTATAEVAEQYVERLREIEKETGGNVEKNQEYHDILVLLTQTVPELSELIDLNTNSIEGGTEALLKHTEAWKADAEQQAQQEYLNTLFENYTSVQTEACENQVKMTQARMKEEAAVKKQAEAQAKANALYAEAKKKASELGGEMGIVGDETAFLTQEYYDLQKEITDYDTEIAAAQKQQQNLTKAIEEDSAAIEASRKEYEEGVEAVKEMNKAQSDAEEAARKLQEQQLTVTDRVQETTEQMDVLIAAYNNSYSAALESIQGQYSIWDEAAEVVAKSVGSMNGSVESQIEYWRDYKANVAILDEAAGQIDGLREMVASFDDGSAESVNAIAGMAKAFQEGDTEGLKELVENYQTLQEEQRNTADSLADMNQNFDEQMGLIKNQLVEDIADMDMADDAYSAGAKTIAGYINGIESQSTALQGTVNGILNDVSLAFIGAKNRNKDSGDTTTEKGYATGTYSAEPGFRKVGENGPEWVLFNGGERVLNAMESMQAERAMSAANGALTLDPEALRAFDAMSAMQEEQGQATQSMRQMSAMQTVQETQIAAATTAIDMQGMSPLDVNRAPAEVISPISNSNSTVNGGTNNVNFAPVLNFSGTTASEDDIRTALADAKDQFKDEFERMMEQFVHRQSRLTFA